MCGVRRREQRLLRLAPRAHRAGHLMKGVGPAPKSGGVRSPQVACVWQGRVAELDHRLQRPEFLGECVVRYRNAGFGDVGDGEYRSWESSWPALVQVLLRAGLGDM